MELFANSHRRCSLAFRHGKELSTSDGCSRAPPPATPIPFSLRGRDSQDSVALFKVVSMGKVRVWLGLELGISLGIRLVNLVSLSKRELRVNVSVGVRSQCWRTPRGRIWLNPHKGGRFHTSITGLVARSECGWARTVKIHTN